MHTKHYRNASKWQWTTEVRRRWQVASSKLNTYHNNSSTHTSCKHRETNSPLTSGETLSFKLSSANNQGVKVQVVLEKTRKIESFKPNNRGDYCLISYHNPEILKLFPRARTQCAKLWLGRLPSLYFDIWCDCLSKTIQTPFLLTAKEEAFILAAF